MYLVKPQVVDVPPLHFGVAIYMYYRGNRSLADNLQGDPLLHGVISSVRCKENPESTLNLN